VITHDVEIITSAHMQDIDHARIRFRCKLCDLKCTVVASPAASAAGLVELARHAPCDGEK
jgi:hypothetical protein